MSHIKRIVGVGALVLLLLGVWKYQSIYQWYFLSNYHPSPEIAALANQAALSDAGRRDFYLSDPQLEDKQEFSGKCPVTEKSLVLGCYVGGGIGRIYVLKVDRPELADVEQVTAAHEMLHSAYAKLSLKERNRVNKLISDFYPTVADPKLKELVVQYDQSEPGERLNELHSILPTQLASLSPELEAYYKKYFTNRVQVAAAYKSYEAVFEKIDGQIKSLKSQLDGLKGQIDAYEADLDAKAAQLEATNRQLDAYRSSGNISAYNALVPKQNAEVNSYNALINQYKAAVNSYNSKVSQLNQLALEQNQLVDSLDSTKFTPR